MNKQDIEKFVKEWMEGFGKDSFTPDKDGIVFFKRGATSINLVFYFKMILIDFIEEAQSEQSSEEVNPTTQIVKAVMKKVSPQVREPKVMRDGTIDRAVSEQTTKVSYEDVISIIQSLLEANSKALNNKPIREYSHLLERAEMMIKQLQAPQPPNKGEQLMSIPKCTDTYMVIHNADLDGYCRDCGNKVFRLTP